MDCRTIKPIETEYKGYLFRSRIEARWAVFFDAMHIVWEYEKEGFDLGADVGRYLPDFWLPDQQYWIEIKGAEPTELEEKRCEELAHQTGYITFVLFGNIPEKFQAEQNGSQSGYVHFVEGWDCFYQWTICPICHKREMQFEGRYDRVSCSCDKTFNPEWDYKAVQKYTRGFHMLDDAYRKARRERFSRLD